MSVKCAWCGNVFEKSYRTEKYCCDVCRKYAKKEQNAKYQRKRRKLIRTGILISNENNYTGTNFLSKHKQPDEHKELLMIEKEMRRLKLR